MKRNYWTLLPGGEIVMLAGGEAPLITQWYARGMPFPFPVRIVLFLIDTKGVT
jgi:hypothetical protein